MALRTALGLYLCILVVLAAPAPAAELVPPGNRSAEQPAVPFASASRTRATRTTYEAKYRKVRDLLERDTGLIRKISAVAADYGIAPIHMVGAIVGEHTYNVDAYDHLQTYYVKAVSYFNSSFGFGYEDESVDAFIQRPEFAACGDMTDSYALWACRERIWDETFRGKIVDGRRFPNNRFSAVFFQPFYAGQTFGIGQLNPLTALRVTDTVHAVSGFEKLDHTQPQRVYRTIMNPDISLAYVAAVLKKSIEAYERIAGFDITQNPGITATLYNLGNPVARAQKLATENRIRRNQGRAPRLPRENYYGWLVNDRLDELKALFAES